MKPRAIPLAAILLSAALLLPTALPAQTAPTKPSDRESSTQEPSARELGETMGQVMEQMGRMMGNMAQNMGGSMQRMLDAVQKEAGLRGRQDEHIEGRLAFLRAELQIASAQENAWNAFADAMRKASAMKPAAAGTDGRGSTLPERLDGQARQLQGRLAMLEAKKAAIDRLYGHLDSRQKTLADDLIEQIGLV